MGGLLVHTVAGEDSQSQMLEGGGVPITEDCDEVCAPLQEVEPSLSTGSSLSLVPVGQHDGVHLAPFIEQAALEAEAAGAPRNDAKLFLREFTRELIRETSSVTKAAVLLLALLLIGAASYFGYYVYRERQRSRALATVQGERLDSQGRKLDEQGRQLDDVRGQVVAVAGQLQGLEETDRSIARSLELAPELWRSYHKGVCLISGTYIFVQPGTNRPLRYREEQLNEEGEPMVGRDDPDYLTAEGDGPVAEFGYVGTGFHVGQGLVLTNRHITSGFWEVDARAELVRGMTGGRPRLTKLLAFFPGRRSPVVLQFLRASRRDDLAVCRIRGAFADVPALPLAEDSDEVSVGERVVTMGYPSGPDRLLALLSEDESVGVQKRYGGSIETLIREFSARGMVRPLTTQGHVTDLSKGHIVNDAATGDGGSGAPLFGKGGRVVGVTFALFTESNASYFAAPVAPAVKLLRQAGWSIKN